MAGITSFTEKLQTLVHKFEKDKVHYLSKGYPEAQVRIDFLNPFFEALGWDIENKAHKPPHERDVLVELSPETTGRPDYNFRIHGATKFFVEAKAPSVALDDVHHILQAKSYAWSTKEVYFVVLTDFEEFKLFDASLKPNPQFPNEGLIFDFKYHQYPDIAEKLWELSKERVEQGSLEALLPRDVKSKRLRIPPDKSFLEDLTGWRTGGGFSQIRLAVPTKGNLDGLISAVIGDEATAILQRSNKLDLRGMTVQLMTERIKPKSFRGPVLAAYTTAEHIKKMSRAGYATDIVFVPWNEEDLGKYLASCVSQVFEVAIGEEAE